MTDATRLADADVATAENDPFVGPRPFRESQRNFFFGRDREAEEMVSLITAHRAVLLYAPSGAGKTSLLNAKLIPELRETEGFDVVGPMRVQGLTDSKVAKKANIYLLNALRSCYPDANYPRGLSVTTLAQFLAARGASFNKYGEPAPRVLIFDQFEELFTSYPSRWEDRAKFFKQLHDVLEGNPEKKIAPDTLLRVLFVMREDYIAEMDTYAHFMPEKLRTRFRLEYLRRGASLQAVTEPLNRAKPRRSFAPGVAEQLVDNLLKLPARGGGDAPKFGQYVEPVQLQVVCQALLHSLGEETVITQQHLDSYGDVGRALTKFYEDSVRAVANETKVKEADLRSWFEYTLITAEGTRSMVYYRGEEQSRGIPYAAVKKLDEMQLIKGESKGEDVQWYELAHDRLIDLIRKSNEEWRATQSKSERARLRLEAKAVRWRQGSNVLLDPVEQIEAKHLVRSGIASDDLRALNEISRVSGNRKRLRQMKLMSIASLVLAALMVGLALWALEQRAEASRKSQLFKSALDLAEARFELLKKAREDTEWEKKAADKARLDAVEARLDADKERDRAVEQTKIAVAAREQAKRQQKIAEQTATDLQKQEEVTQRALADAKKDRDLAFAAEAREAGLKEKAENATKKAESSLLAQIAAGRLEINAEESLLLAREARKLTPTALAEQVVRDILPTLPEFMLESGGRGVTGAEFGPDGRILTTGMDGKARLWSAEGGPLRVLDDRGSSPLRASFSPDGRRILTTSEDAPARLFDGETFKAVELSGRSVTTPTAFSHGKKAEGKEGGKGPSEFVATASSDGVVRVWKTGDGSLVAELADDPPGQLLQVAFHPSDSWLLAAKYSNGSARLWDVKGKRYVQLPGLSSGESAALAFSADGGLLAMDSGVRGGQGQVKVWDVVAAKSLLGSTPGSPGASAGTLKERYQFNGVRGRVSTIGFAPNNSRLILVAGSDGAMNLWLALSASAIPGSSLVGHTRYVYDARFSPDGKFVVSASGDGTARVWDLSGEPIAVLRGPGSGTPDSVSFNSKGDRIVWASYDGPALVWDVGQKIFPVLRGHEGSVLSAEFRPTAPGEGSGGEEPLDLLTAGEDYTARVWNARTGRDQSFASMGPLSHGGKVLSASYSVDGRWVVTASADGTARVWATGTQVTLPDGSEKILYGVGDLKCTATVALGRAVRGAKFDNEGRRIIVALSDNTARLWDVAEPDAAGRCQTRDDYVLTGHRGGVNSAVFGGDRERAGRYIVTASEDGTAIIWDAKSLSRLATLYGHRGPVESAAFSRDEGLVVTAGSDKTARVWNTDRCIRDGRCESDMVLPGHTERVNSAMFSGDKRFVVTASDDRTVRVWDLEACRNIAILRGHNGPVNSAAFHPSGKYIVTAGVDGVARIYAYDAYAPYEEIEAKVEKRVKRTLAAEDWQKYLNVSPACEKPGGDGRR